MAESNAISTQLKTVENIITAKNKIKSCEKRNKSPTLPPIKCLAKKFMNDPSSFEISDPNEINVGPGSYELPPVIGTKRSKFVKKNVSQLISRGKNSPEREPSIEKLSPNPCKYDPNKEAVLKKSPRIAKQTEDRFKWLENKQPHIPILYEPDINTKLKRHGVFFLRKNNL